MTERDKYEQSRKEKRKKLSYIESLYNRVKGSIKLDPNLPPFRANTGNTEYYMGGAKINFGAATKEYMEREKATLEQIYNGYAYVIIHELIHRAAKKGTYSDVQVLNAVIEIMKEDGLEPSERTENAIIASGRIDSSFMANYCRIP